MEKVGTTALEETNFQLLSTCMSSKAKIILPKHNKASEFFLKKNPNKKHKGYKQPSRYGDKEYKEQKAH